MTHERRRRRRKWEPHPPANDPVPIGNCYRTGKKRYETRREARAHLRGLKAKGRTGSGIERDVAGLGTYRCKRYCGDWHVGHRPKMREVNDEG